jgi:hypothetical protein
MRKSILTLLVCLILTTALAQVPQGINYQAVARTAQGLIIPNQAIGTRFSILDGTINGTVVYQETFTTQTNSFGLFTLVIGKGTPVTGTFAGINWASGTDKFLKVEIAPTGGNNYQLQGTSQLMSVPYALYADKTKLISGNNTINITNGNTITGNYVAANNTLNINGNAISGNYQAGNSTLLINGNTITGNYVAANNTLLINGNTISGNYQAGNNTLLINGNNITGNYVAGSGISITGNVISSTASGQWLNHPNGIYYPAANTAGNVGIRTTPSSSVSLVVNGNIPGVLEGNTATFTSSSNWHTQFTLQNSASSSFFTFVVGGPGNTEILPRNFGLFNSNTARWPLTIGGLNNNVGIGDPLSFPTIPKSALHIKKGDVYIDENTSGVILKSPNGNCWRVTIDNMGNMVRTAISCP